MPHTQQQGCISDFTMKQVNKSQTKPQNSNIQKSDANQICGETIIACTI